MCLSQQEACRAGAGKQGKDWDTVAEVTRGPWVGLGRWLQARASGVLSTEFNKTTHADFPDALSALNE